MYSKRIAGTKVAVFAGPRSGLTGIPEEDEVLKLVNQMSDLTGQPVLQILGMLEQSPVGIDQLREFVDQLQRESAKDMTFEVRKQVADAKEQRMKEAYEATGGHSRRAAIRYLKKQAGKESFTKTLFK